METLVHLDGWQWALAALAAFLVGLSKTGIAGIGIFAVAVFALIFPAAKSVGLVLPILICADVAAVTFYRRSGSWPHLWRLFPWAAAGVVLGYAAVRLLERLGDKTLVNHIIARTIGGILIVMVATHLTRQWAARNRSPDTPSDVSNDAAADGSQQAQEQHVPSLWFTGTMGLLAGFTTMVANAAGPVMIIYLLAMRLPKMEFIGTAAWYFLVLNLFKIPFNYDLGWIDVSSFALDVKLFPFAIAGAVLGRMLISRINQELFERVALALTVVAGLRLLLG